MGAWIEIRVMVFMGSDQIKVAPFMGAWIEILKDIVKNLKQATSHPLWVRGLKYKHSLEKGN